MLGPDGYRDLYLTDIVRCGGSISVSIQVFKGEGLCILCKGLKIPCTGSPFDLVGIRIKLIGDILIGFGRCAATVQIGKYLELCAVIGDTHKSSSGGIVSSHSDLASHHVHGSPGHLNSLGQFPLDIIGFSL